MVEFQYFDGCPNSEVTLSNLRALVEEHVIPETTFVITNVRNPEEGERLRFLGSPTILVNGKDLYTGHVPAGAAYSCRTYTIDGKRTGVLSKQFIETRYHELGD